MVTGGSIAVKDPGIFLSWLETYGSDKIILGADHKEGKIAVSGWAETSDNDLINYILDYTGKGIKKVISTDVSVDGMLNGPGMDVYKRILQEVPGIELTASGGVGNMDHVYNLKDIGVQHVIVGKAIYEGFITKHDITNFLT
jgi:phosphoribosylformimino-5-aminoimidazole carboxamide ribotide isomerase